jgi:RIO kinase 1
MIKTLYDKAELVHGDISEYNILVPNGYPVLIDFAQAVTKEHPQSREFLQRDVENLNNYFVTTYNIKPSKFDKIFPEESS